MITCIVNYKLLDRAAKARHLTVERLLEVAVFCLLLRLLLFLLLLLLLLLIVAVYPLLEI